MFLYRIHHVMQQGNIPDELFCRYAAYMPHQKILTDNSVLCRDNIIFSRIEKPVCNLEIDKTRVIHEDEARLLRSELFHAYLLIFEFCLHELGD